jgi:hypothetical protein
MTTRDLTELYRSSHVRVCERVSALSPVGLTATVPATPLWTVADLVAHLTGVVSDARFRRPALGDASACHLGNPSSDDGRSPGLSIYCWYDDAY